ncbi:protein of unknown function [Streptantibioticus cattleyicolor NRRL 8057 = DSM 46488]|nr:protein of unknown function [Streptantibioticus cattleyicolor NRRL 8057 = DSM 46488]
MPGRKACRPPDADTAQIPGAATAEGPPGPGAPKPSAVRRRRRLPPPAHPAWPPHTRPDAGGEGRFRC